MKIRNIIIWKNNIKMTEEEEKAVVALRKSSCKCDLPLLGYIYENNLIKNYRCRICNIEVNNKE